MRQRITVPVLLVLSTACGANDVRPRPSNEQPKDAGSHETVGPLNPDDTGESGIGSGPTSSDGGGSATSPEAGVETLPASNECAGVVCDVFASCTGGDEPRCTCAPGLEGDGQRCSDIDECQSDVDVCGSNAICENSFAGFSCRCQPGYKLNGDVCVADQACAESPCADDATCSSEPTLTCVCHDGYFGNGFFCTTAQPCVDAPCGDQGECVAVGGTQRDFVCACPLGAHGTANCSTCGEELALQDPELERAVRQQLGIPPDDTRPILVSELSSHSSLSASEFGVTNLSGLECWPSLQVLDLSYNAELKNAGAEALGSLNRLTELRLDCTQITDLSLVDGHPNLRSLSVNVLNCDDPVPVDSTAPVATLPQLEVLDLRGQGVSDVSVLSGLRNLRSLWLGYNELNSLDDILHLSLLTELDVSFNHLESIEGVERLSRLQYLNVSNNELTSLQSTAGLTALRALNASGNGVSELPNWVDTSLSQIDVSSNAVSSVVPLAALNRVAWVSAAGNAITTLAPLLEGSLRGTLVVAGNVLPCDDQAGVIAELRTLGLDVQGDCVP